MEHDKRIEVGSLGQTTRAALLAGGMSVAAVAVLVFALPFDDDNVVFYIAFGLVHAAAIAPLAWLNPKIRGRIVALCFAAGTFGFWAIGVFLVAGSAGAFACGVIWACLAGPISGRPFLAIGLFLLGVLYPLLALIPLLVPAFQGPSTDATSAFLPIAAWHLIATLMTYGECMPMPPSAVALPNCKACDYSLVGLTTNTCPECGEPISPPASPPSAHGSAP